MANEINHRNDDTGLNLYMTRELNGQIWNGVALENFNVANWSAYATALQETPAGSYRYVGNMTGLPAGRWAIRIFQIANIDGVTKAISDPRMGEGPFDWDGTAEVTLASLKSMLDRIKGLVLHNHVEDDIVRDANGLKTSSTIYLYDSAANATAHDKVTGLIGKYTATPHFTNQLMSLFKSVQVI